ncbi:GTP-binding protein [Sediminitomix flava]|uniref:Probable GTP-binding protein EngB n=2 Tax=Sediminitomix flava TaxID=379075 RepID=A0A316A5P0_SEDFL|nr:GTP-binding protein [Sediminitomix flava]
MLTITDKYKDNNCISLCFSIDSKVKILHMKIKKAEFVMSNQDYRKCPPADKAEYAFIGRSNVGKSSLINAMTNHKGLAKTSGTPGKTQLINHFIINDNWYLVDLPGYGYAQVSKTIREKFQKLIDGYLLNRENLYCTFVLVDSRHNPQKIDLDFMEWMATNGLPFCIIFTKADKLKKTEKESKINNYLKKLQESWEELPQYFVTSSEKKEGLEELLTFIDQVSKSANA